jgi:2-dehydro-3-deoxyphosphogluconate aldolase/(4S)-4-hydroxy-2-oxoglutarate aldolase
MVKDRMAVLAAMMDQGVIPVFHHADAATCIEVIQACADGGAKCVEFTNRGEFAAETFAEVTRHFARADPSVIMGAGSSEASLRAWFEAGVVAVGIGSNLVTKPLLDAQDWKGVEARVRQTVELIRKIRGQG